MNFDKKIFSLEEEAAMLRQEDIEDSQAHGLYSLSPTWFRHSEYEVIGDGFYNVGVKARPGAKLEWYRPFEEFPKILEDFLMLMLSVEDIYKSRPSDQNSLIVDEYFKFISNYGHFGLYWEHLKTVGQPMLSYGVDPDVNVAKNKRFFDNLKAFFPVSKAPVYLFGELGSSSELSGINVNEIFLADYTERIVSIDANDSISNIRQHVAGHNNNLTVENIGITIDGSDLAWAFGSLINALGIMYLNNATAKLGEKLNICQLKECNNIIRGRKYCNKLHAERDRKRRQRAKPKEGVK